MFSVLRFLPGPQSPAPAAPSWKVLYHRRVCSLTPAAVCCSLLVVGMEPQAQGMLHMPLPHHAYQQTIHRNTSKYPEIVVWGVGCVSFFLYSMFFNLQKLFLLFYKLIILYFKQKKGREPL